VKGDALYRPRRTLRGGGPLAGVEFREELEKLAALDRIERK